MGLGTKTSEYPSTMSLFLAGDVMTGRGIDQILTHPSPPRLCETYVHDALEYVRLAERRNGPIARPVPFTYVWGDLLAELEERRPDVRLVNLETAITRSDAAMAKGINYRMNPANIGVLTAARIDACALANNHVMDWGAEGLLETLSTLHRAAIVTAGAGRDREEATRPAIVPIVGKGRVLLLSLGLMSSGIPEGWAARPDGPGVNLASGSVEEIVADVAAALAPIRQVRDVVVASIHWGANWGYETTPDERALAHALIDRAGVDVVHGHSSHHPRAIEAHRGRLILYGCGDLVNDYEGISGYEEFRGELTIACFACVSALDGTLSRLDLVPFRIQRMRLHRAGDAECRWLASRLTDVCETFRSSLSCEQGNVLSLSWR